MVGLGIAFFLLVAGPASAGEPVESREQISSEMAVERTKKCGLGTARIRYDDELQSDILSLPLATSATDSQLMCLDAATGFGIFVKLPSSLQSRFDALREARATVIVKTEAGNWLAKRGLFDGVPKYVPGTTDDATFTQTVEQLCGPKAKGAFGSQFGLHVLSPQWINGLGEPPNDDGMEALSCVLNVTTVADYRMGFIGNEAFRQ